MSEEGQAGIVDGTPALTRLLLDDDGAAAAEERRHTPQPDVLPGVGSEEMSLREGLRVGGPMTFMVLMSLVAFDELEGAALTVLAPDIRDTFGVSDGAIVFMTSAAAAFIVLGSLPMGLLADRVRRGRVIAAAAALFSTMVVLSGLAVNAFMLFWTRAGVGVAKSSTNTVHGSLLGDTYPIGVRGRVGAANAMAGRVVATVSPLAVGAVAAAAGGDEGWRWAFLLLGLPSIAIGWWAWRLPEPVRGQFEKLDVLGELTDDDPAPVSMEAGFARLMQIRSLRMAIVAFAVLGFGLFTGPVINSLYLEDRFGLDAFDRGVLGTIGGIVVLAVLPFVGRYYDGLYRRSPERALALVGWLVLPSAVFTPLQYLMPNEWLFAVAGIPNLVVLSAAFTMIGPILQGVVPYRLRGVGAALGAVYIFFIGAVGGGFLSFLLLDSIGQRATVMVILVPSSIVGALMLVRSASFIRDDLAMIVADLREEQAESHRRAIDPEALPALSVHDVDFSYGTVQILFDVSFEVRRGEVLALLGTNGAGKSTVLRAIAGLGTPSRGSIRLHGRNITYSTPEQRARMGIQLLPGGKGVFPALSVMDNLRVGGFSLRRDRSELDTRIARVLELFPQLAERPDQIAGSMSGGQQQMLALARVLLHDPELLIIDELSLGLAPVVVQDLLAVIERLKTTGMTIIIVEQSLNVALAFADRAIFMEKGRVRFEGSAAELATRGDLARAVFLGGEGG